jgi:hypothetical protein
MSCIFIYLFIGVLMLVYDTYCVMFKYRLLYPKRKKVLNSGLTGHEESCCSQVVIKQSTAQIGG